MPSLHGMLCDGMLSISLTIVNLLAVLYKLKLGQSVTTIPTVGFNVETVTYKNIKFNVWVSELSPVILCAAMSSLALLCLLLCMVKLLANAVECTVCACVTV